MRPLIDREKRTIRLATVAIAIYLVVFFGLRGWKTFEGGRREYQQLVQEAQRLRREVQPYENKALLLEKLKNTFNLDPAKVPKASLVAEASAAIQKAASTGGVQLGPIRESAARPSAKELASMQLEGFGPVPAVMTLLHRLDKLGYPLIVDAVQIGPDARQPGMIKVNLTVIILDFEQWKTEEKRNA